MHNTSFRSVLSQYRRCVEDSQISRWIATDVALSVWKLKGQLQDTLWYLQIIKEHVRRGAPVLDFGCGYAFFSCLLAESGYKSYGLEVAAPQVSMMSDKDGSLPVQGDNSVRWWPIWTELLKQWRLNLNLYDGKNLPYDSNCFEAVVAIAVLEHIPVDDINICLREIWRVLKPGGLFFVFKTPRKGSYAEWLASRFGIGHHDRLLDQEWYGEKIQNAGFNILQRDVHDLILRGGLRLQWLLNLLEPLLNILEKCLLKTRLRRYAHHMMFICQKQI